MKAYKNKFGDFSFVTYYVTDKKDLKILDKLSPGSLLGIDIETSKKEKWKEHKQAGLDPYLSDIRLLQISDGDISVVIDLRSVPLNLLHSILRTRRFVAHNALFEIMHLSNAGYTNLNIGCSMLLSQIIDVAEHTPYEKEDEEDEDKTGLSQYRRNGHSLDAVIQRLFGLKVAKQEQVSDWGAEVLSQNQILYAALDAVLTLKAAQKMSGVLVSHKMVKAYQLLKDSQHVVAHMQLTGVPVDWSYHAKMIESWKEKLIQAEKKCQPYFKDVNVRSGKQMNAWIREYLKDKPLILSRWPETKKSTPQNKIYTFTRNKIFTFSDLPAISALLEFRKWAKLIDTYGESLLEKRHPITGRLHTSYTLGMTTTGRASSREPNVQNFPRDKEFRNMFAVDNTDNVFIVADFSQIELRLQAEFSQDPVMLKAYRDNEDIYCMMASFLYGKKITKKEKSERFVGKTCMLALGYGMGPNKMMEYAANAGINKPLSFWQNAHKIYHERFHVYSKWCNTIRKRAEKLGYIETLLGKRRKLAADDLYTKAPNTVIQGTAWELMCQSMINVHKKLKSNMFCVLTVHDELKLMANKKDAEHGKKLLEDSMNGAMKQLFPRAVTHHVADAAYGIRWGDIKAEL